MAMHPTPESIINSEALYRTRTGTFGLFMINAVNQIRGLDMSYPPVQTEDGVASNSAAFGILKIINAEAIAIRNWQRRITHSDNVPRVLPFSTLATYYDAMSNRIADTPTKKRSKFVSDQAELLSPGSFKDYLEPHIARDLDNLSKESLFGVEGIRLFNYQQVGLHREIFPFIFSVYAHSINQPISIRPSVIPPPVYQDPMGKIAR